ncbi:MAG: histidinol dehydrogenase, partial [Eubacterium sp.]|nr:histidinol dehydrogenase [Eubacterium sp.]
SGDPAVVAADLLAQAEHDVNAKALLVSLDRDFAQAVIKAVEKELSELPTADIARESWKVNGEVLLAACPDEAIELANRIAPEHLELNVAEPEIYFAAGGDACEAPKLRNFGSLFIGQNTAEVFGDYASGTNHTLPTVRAARYTGGLYVGNFLKTCTYQSMTDEASRELSKLTARLAYGEGLYGHARAAELRGAKPEDAE